ncbi:MAG TPA: transposase, partial [Nitrospirota bacterium]|nr:transposase [Nitrospirota bacterium]
MATDAGDAYDFTDVQTERMLRKERHAKHYQKMMGRRQTGSKRRNRASMKAAGCRRYAADVRNDFAHKTSRSFVNSDKEVFVFEDLSVKNMT